MAFISEFGKNILHECSTKDNPIYLLFPKQTLVHLLTFIIDDLLKMAFFLGITSDTCFALNIPTYVSWRMYKSKSYIREGSISKHPHKERKKSLFGRHLIYSHTYVPICVFRCTQTMWWKSPWLNVKEGCTLRQLSFWWPFGRNTSGMGNLESNVLPQSKQNFGKMMWKMCTPHRGIVFWRCSKSKKVSGQVICFKTLF